MIRHGSRGWNTESQAAYLGSRGRRGRRLWGLEGLEDRLLLSATVYMVTDTSGNASDTGSLPYAVNEANNNDNNNPAGSIIKFSSSAFSVTSPGIIDLNSTLQLYSKGGPIVIQGASTASGANIVQINGNDTVLPFSVGGGQTATISGVTIADGVNSYEGGGILNDGNLTLNDTVITDCTAQSLVTTDGLGTGGEGGGIWSAGSLTVTDCTFTNDQADDATGIAGGEGGGIYVVPATTVSVSNDSTFNNDQASLGGGIYIASILDTVDMFVFGTLTLTGGSITNCTGGGIEDNGGNATVTGCTLSGNKAATTGFDGGNFDGGIDNNGGVAVLSGDTIVKNSAQYGSGVSNSGMMTITNSTISNNSSGFSSYGGGIYNSGDMDVNACTIASNTVSTGMGGGIYNTNGEVGPGQLFVVNSTIAYNEAAQGGGIDSNTPLTIVNSTIAYNNVVVPSTGGAHLIFGAGGGLDVTSNSNLPVLENTIVAQNSQNYSIPDDINGSVAPVSAYNLIGTGGSGGMTNNSQGNLVGVANPGLSSLASNGGPTQTIGLYYGSPALNAGSVALAVDPSTSQPLTYDQRGAGFPRTLNGAVDIGAFEGEVSYTFHILGLEIFWGILGDANLVSNSNGSQLPAGRKTDLPWTDITSFQLTFSQPVVLTASDVTIQSVRGINYGPVTVTGSGMSYTVMFAQPIDKADRVTITASITGTMVFSGILNVLPGDVLGAGVVNSKDIATIRKDEKNSSAPSSIYANILGGATVTSADFTSAKRLIGTKLPKIVIVKMHKHPKASLARDLVHSHLGRK